MTREEFSEVAKYIEADITSNWATNLMEWGRAWVINHAPRTFLIHSRDNFLRQFILDTYSNVDFGEIRLSVSLYEVVMKHEYVEYKFRLPDRLQSLALFTITEALKKHGYMYLTTQYTQAEILELLYNYAHTQ